MGARTLEAKLTARLLSVLAPALVAVGAAAVALAWWALAASDTEVVRGEARSALAVMHAELVEPDPFDVAAAEVLATIDAVGGVAVVRDLLTGRTYGTKRAAPPALAVAVDRSESVRCATVPGAAGEPWRACIAGDDRVEVIAAIDVSPHARVVRTVAEGVAIGILLALFAAALAARASLKGALASVRALVRWSEGVVDASDVPPAPEADTREIASLATAFDAVVRRLVDASARARATSENIAHELRTPLTTIRAELEALTPSPENAAAVARLQSDVEGLTRVVDEILILAVPPARSRAGGSVLNLADLARELAPPETHVYAPDEALVMAEERLVELAITNLLENARKHTGREARTISLSRAGDLIRLAVVDEGPGLDDDARARMFDRYWRASDDGGGTGLGLALVRAVARRHGGEADARPNADGRGLEVGLTFANVVGWHQK